LSGGFEQVTLADILLLAVFQLQISRRIGVDFFNRPNVVPIEEPAAAAQRLNERPLAASPPLELRDKQKGALAPSVWLQTTIRIADGA
jgi:hypothetical protein